MAEDKYFAYYIPENKPILLCNIKEIIQAEHGVYNSISINEQIEAILQLNDYDTILNDNIEKSLNSLVLVKFSLVNDIFFKDNMDNNNMNHADERYQDLNNNNNRLLNYKTVATKIFYLVDHRRVIIK